VTDWIPYFNGATPRPQQLECLDAIEASQADVVVVQAPTGAGKSLIQLGHARRLRHLDPRATSYIVTPQRALQAQLADGNDDVCKMQGAANYRCWAYERAPERHSRHDGCPFYLAVDRAVASPIVVHNYASLLHRRKHFPRRRLLCLDEGHRASAAVGDFLTLEIESTERDYLPGGEASFDAMRELAAAGERTGCESLDRKLYQMQSMWWLYGLDAPEDDEADEPWDGETLDLDFRPVSDDYTGTTQFVPTRLAPAGHVITGRGEKVLIVSATVLDAKLLCAELGLGKRSVEYIELGSDFPIENRPIIGRYCGKMSQKHQSVVLPRVLKALAGDMARHKDEAGIVHTVSYQLAEQVVRGLNDPRCVKLPRGEGRDTTIAKFLAGELGKGRVLVGPGLHEGIDAVGDAARWQAIVKSPYPYLGDVRVKAMLERNEGMARRWLEWQEAITLIQMLGRIVRSREDWGTTYVYDSRAHDVLNGPFCPRYVREAVR